jgi:hypothetical protein
MMEIPSLGEQAPIATHIRMVGNALEHARVGIAPLGERQHVAFLLCKDFSLALAASLPTFDMDVEETISPPRDVATRQITQFLPMQSRCLQGAKQGWPVGRLEVAIMRFGPA